MISQLKTPPAIATLADRLRVKPVITELGPTASVGRILKRDVAGRTCEAFSFPVPAGMTTAELMGKFAVITYLGSLDKVTFTQIGRDLKLAGDLAALEEAHSIVRFSCRKAETSLSRSAMREVTAIGEAQVDAILARLQPELELELEELAA